MFGVQEKQKCIRGKSAVSDSAKSLQLELHLMADADLASMAAF
jgi:hypothetical protein